MEASILMRSIKPYIKWTPLVFGMVFLTPASSAQDFIEGFNDENFINTSLTTANLSTEEQTVYLAWSNPNNDSGSFADSGTPIGNDSDDDTNSVALGDVNGDGYPDLVAGNKEINKLYLNDGSGGFEMGTDIGNFSESTYSVVLADMDGDGDLDLVAGGLVQDKLYLNDGSGVFDPSTDIGIDNSSNKTVSTKSVAQADVDGDGDLDLVAGRWGSNEINKLYLNTGSGIFDAGTDIGSNDIGGYTLSVALGDVNGDGYADLMVGNDSQTNKLYLNDGFGVFPDSGTPIGSNDFDPTVSLALADVDGDGDLDLVAGNYQQNNKLYLNDSSGIFGEGTDIGGWFPRTNSVALADMDSDGDLDLVEGATLAINKLYLNDSSGSFDAGTDISSDNNKTYSVAPVDVDGDGDLDLVAGNYDQINRLYLNNASASLLVQAYNINSGHIHSNKVNGETTGILAVTLESTAVVNTEATRNTSIDYFVTNTGGNTWYKVIPGIKFIFPNSGTDDVRWRAKLNSLSPVRTPELNEVRLTYFFDEDAPVITLTGNDSITLEVGESFTDPGATATDLVDGDLTDSIVTTGTVDPNTVNTYTLTYTVSDAAGNEATATLTVNVEDTIAPVITSGTTAANLAENSGVGQTVYTITASDIGGVTSFGIGGDDFGFLGVDNSTGAVTLTANPDYETKSSYSFTVTASDTANNTSAETIVTFLITNVEDQAPQITSGITGTDLVENSGAGQTVYTITATDDVGVTRYDIGGTDAGLLSVNSSTGVVTLTANPDYETKSSYSFTVTAVDAADNTSAETTVTFLITNVEDQAPQITSGITGIDLVENSGAGQTVYTITATDDVGVTRYDIGGTDAGLLGVDNSTGVVTLTANPDYETKSSYSFTVTAIDAANNTSAETTVTFSITVESASLTLIIPEDITVPASGYLTAVNLDPESVASGTDREGNTLPVSVDQTGPFVSGPHDIVWSVSDGNSTVSKTQILKVVPLVTTAMDTYVDEGTSISIAFLLSGEAADYPVTVPFSLSGTAVQGEDYSIDASDSSVTIDQGTRGHFNLTIIAGALLGSQKTIEINLGSLAPTNAVAGLPQQQVITIVEENIAPQLSFIVTQVTNAGESVTSNTVAADAGVVTITPDIEDPNSSDTYIVDWSDALDRLPSALVDSETQSLTFNPETLLGVYSITAAVTDSGNPPYDVTDTVVVNVVATAPILADDQDTDGDGILDSQEGTGDSDGDNVPDYLDAISAPHILVLNNSSETLSISVPDIQLALGALAQAQGDHDASISEAFMASQGVARDIGYDYPFDLADFIASGMQSGYSYPIVHSLGDKVIPEGAVYRNYLGENLGWQDFVENAANEVYSTFAQQGACPAANAENYSEGLTAGHNCVFLLIEDGGPNDADSMVNGTVANLGGIAIKYIGVPSANSRIVLGKSMLVANGTDTTTITVWAYDEQQLPLTNMLVTATIDIHGVTVSRFVDQGDGSYTATMTAGTYSGIGQVQVEIDNGDIAVALLPERLALTAVQKARTSGGCTVATGHSTDSSLILILVALLLFRFRRRGALTVIS